MYWSTQQNPQFLSTKEKYSFLVTEKYYYFNNSPIHGIHYTPFLRKQQDNILQ